MAGQNASFKLAILLKIKGKQVLSPPLIFSQKSLEVIFPFPGIFTSLLILSGRRWEER